jgi:hypothetical protein
VEHLASYPGIIEQFDRQRLPDGTSRALRCAEYKEMNKRDPLRHAGQRTHRRAGPRLFESEMKAAD